jgi:outer membrane protein assembly factor BamB
MNLQKTKKILSIALVLMFAFSIVAVSIPIAESKITVTASIIIQNQLGVNSPALIAIVPTPSDSNPLQYSSNYKGKPSVWPNAVATFIRPDGTKDVINGPFKTRPQIIAGHDPDIEIVYTPNMKGNWSVNFYWPGDDTYNPINTTRAFPFPVGDYFPKRDAWAFLSMRPYPVVGLGQTLLINAWVTPPPINGIDYYEGYMFTFNSPSGKSFTVGPMDSETPATVWFDLPLTELGEWTIKFDFPGDHISLPASITRKIIVQPEWVPTYPDTPLPTEEWTFPINVENREWRNIAGPWYQSNYNASGGGWNPYTEAPKTAHVLWKLPSTGQIGGYMGLPHSIQTGGGVEAYGAGDAGIFTSSPPSIRTVMAGRGYYTASGNIICVDMRTGEQIWSVPGSFNAGAREGRTAYLYSFGTRLIKYDAITGAVALNTTGLSSAMYVHPHVYSSSAGRIIKWTVEGTSTNFTTRIIWNITDNMPSTSSSYSVISSNNMWVARFTNPYDAATALFNNVTGLNLDTGTYQYAYAPYYTPTDPTTWMYRQGPAIGAGYGLVYFAAIPHENNGMGYQAINASTGKIVWTSEAADYPWGNFWAYLPQACAYGMTYGLSYSGVYAFNMTNGKIVWHYSATDTFNEEPYSSNIDAKTNQTYASYSFGSTGPVVGGGIVFAPNTEHSPTFIYRGQQLHAIDASTGNKVWSILGVYTPTAIAYGTLLASDSYNGYTYAFGKGSTETTISTSSKVVTKGSSILLEGTVLDTSSAQKGTAAVSDDSQTAWMEYLHMQQPKPTNATGVRVHLTAKDPNGNSQDIGVAISDTNGKYGISWTPPTEGAYHITATFEGSEAYYSSQETTYIAVGPSSAIVQPTAAPTTTPTIAPTTTASPSPVPEAGSSIGTEVYVAVAAVVVIAVVAAAALVLRKRK